MLQKLIEGSAFVNPAAGGPSLISIISIHAKSANLAYNKYTYALDNATHAIGGYPDPNLLKIAEDGSSAEVIQPALTTLIGGPNPTMARGLGYLGGSLAELSLLVARDNGFNARKLDLETLTFGGADFFTFNLNDDIGNPIEIKDGASFVANVGILGPDDAFIIDSSIPAADRLLVWTDTTAGANADGPVPLPGSRVPIDLAIDEANGRLIILADDGVIFYMGAADLVPALPTPTYQFMSKIHDGSVSGLSLKIWYNIFDDIADTIPRVGKRTGSASDNVLIQYAYDKYKMEAVSISPVEELLIGNQKAYKILSMFRGVEGEIYGSPFSPGVTCKAQLTGDPKGQLARDSDGEEN